MSDEDAVLCAAPDCGNLVDPSTYCIYCPICDAEIPALEDYELISPPPPKPKSKPETKVIKRLDPITRKFIRSELMGRVDGYYTNDGDLIQN